MRAYLLKVRNYYFEGHSSFTDLVAMYEKVLDEVNKENMEHQGMMPG